MKEQIHEISLFLYNLTLYPLILLSFLFYFFLIFSYFLRNKSQIKLSGRKFYPFVTIQIPVYNDPIVERCIRSCLKLDYPKSKYEIIVVDDSTDEKTRKIIDKYKDKVKILRRNSREGFKPGALNYALNYTKGDIIVVFDADWIVPKNFLKKIVKYFEDEKVALVQAKQNFINKRNNYISKFASLLQLIHYSIILRIYSLFSIAFGGGTAMAVRTKYLREVGGWNANNLTEDFDLSIKLLAKGYKVLYLYNFEAKGEVPTKLYHFLRQQRRWVFGITRSLVENFREILVNKNFSFLQKLMIFSPLIFYSFSLIAALSFIFSTIAWLTGSPKPLTFDDVFRFFTVFALTSGFIVLSIFVSKKERISNPLETLMLCLFLGPITAINNSAYFLKALFTKNYYWIKTPKKGNMDLMKKYLSEKEAKKYENI